MIDNYTVDNLRKVAKKMGLVGYSRLRKAELIKFIKSSKNVKKSPIKLQKSTCENVKCARGKICNPKSGRCVLKSGKIGQEIMNKVQTPIQVRPTNTKYTKLIANKGINMFTKKGCGYCDKSKELLKNKNIKYQFIEVTDLTKHELFASIDNYTNKYRTFPLIFVNDKFIGGFSELSKYIQKNRI